MRVVFPFHLLRHCIRNQEELGTYFVPHTHQPKGQRATKSGKGDKDGNKDGWPRSCVGFSPKLATLGTEGEHQGGVQGIGEGRL